MIDLLAFSTADGWAIAHDPERDEHLLLRPPYRSDRVLRLSGDAAHRVVADQLLPRRDQQFLDLGSLVDHLERERLEPGRSFTELNRREAAAAILRSADATQMREHIRFLEREWLATDLRARALELVGILLGADSVRTDATLQGELLDFLERITVRSPQLPRDTQTLDNRGSEPNRTNG